MLSESLVDFDFTSLTDWIQSHGACMKRLKGITKDLSHALDIAKKEVMEQTERAEQLERAIETQKKESDRSLDGMAAQLQQRLEVYAEEITNLKQQKAKLESDLMVSQSKLAAAKSTIEVSSFWIGLYISH